MSIEITVRDIANSVESLGSFVGKEIDACASYKISRAMSQIQSEMEVFSKVQMNLFKKYGNEETDDENKVNIVVPPEKISALNEELNPVLDSKIKLNVNKINVSELKGYKVDPVVFVRLHWLFMDDSLEENTDIADVMEP